jgi:hypothetical protein
MYFSENGFPACSSLENMSCRWVGWFERFVLMFSFSKCRRPWMGEEQSSLFPKYSISLQIFQFPKLELLWRILIIQCAAGGETGRGYVFHRTYVPDFFEVWEKARCFEPNADMVYCLAFIHSSSDYAPNLSVLPSSCRAQDRLYIYFRSARGKQLDAAKL